MLTRRGKHIARVALGAIGSLEIALDVDLFRLSAEDRAFVDDLLRMLKDHERRTAGDPS